MNPAPGFKKYPGHRVDTRPSSTHIRVIYKGEVLADTRDAVELHESYGEGKKTVAAVVYYIPREDVKMDRLSRTSHSTHCPFKGGAENAVWSYEQPYDEMAAIKGHLAFYPDKVDSIEAS
jgi:uncharacterized protein (DUF427 family)